MSDLSHAVGQRWVSNNEAELGLGIISSVTGRRLEVYFPAAEEQRTYAVDNAPLSRVRYRVGETIQHKDGTSIKVTQVEQLNGCVVYLGEDHNNAPQTVHEIDLNSQIQFSQPQQRLFAGQIDKPSLFDLRLRTHGLAHQSQKSPIYGLSGGRVQLLPHQFYIAEQVGTRLAPRVLLADEVGLGKTIEAGLILHQQLLTGRANRVLIVVPETLLHQWLVEMLRRFNLSFTIIDEERHDALVELDEGNPFESAQLVLCSLQSLLASPKMQIDALNADWDLLIVDEAHHLNWQPENASEEYQLVAQLAAQTPGVLLLTATPQQLGVHGHFARLKLLDPSRYTDLVAFEAEQQNYHVISDLLSQVSALSASKTLSAKSSLAKALADYLTEEVLLQLQDVDTVSEGQTTAQQQLLDRFGTGRILYRNTREVVTGFPERKLEIYALSTPTSDVTDATAWLRPEWVLGDSWLENDPRVDWVTNWLKAQRGEKVLLICESAETAQQLEAYLRVKQGVRTAVFHEQMTLIQRDRAAAYFADEEEGAQLLVCSEIGSEGRNFQFCHHLICFDLPQNPDLLEQRIGRLDRIGQRQQIQIHVPYYENTGQQRLLDWYHQGLNAFESVQNAGGQILAEVIEQFETMLAQPENKTLAEKCLADTQAVHQRIKQTLQQGRDRLLEQHSFNAEVAENILGEVDAASKTHELADFIADFCDAFGVDQQVHSADTVILTPGDQMRQQDMPGLPEDGMTATFSRQKALSREDMAFLTWEHPLVRGALDNIIHQEIGNSTFCLLADSRFTPGSLLIEAIFILQTTAPANLQLARYLPEQNYRLLLDEKGRDYAEDIDSDVLSRLVGRIPKNTAQQLVQHARSRIEKLIEKAQAEAKSLLPPAIAQAQQALHTLMQAEINRLQQLAKVNPAVHPDEITSLQTHQQQAEEALASVQLRLDAIRVMIVTEPK